MVRSYMTSRIALVGIMGGLCLAGCTTAPVKTPDPSPASAQSDSLSQADIDFADALAHYSYAWLCATDGLDESFHHFEKAVELDREAEGVALVVAKEYVAEGRLDDTKVFLEEARVARPERVLLGMSIV